MTRVITAFVIAVSFSAFDTDVAASRSSQVAGDRLALLSHSSEFFPTSARVAGFAQGSSSHESITLEALIEGKAGEVGLVPELFAGVEINARIRAAVQEISAANADVDKDQTPRLHFDAESFKESQSRLKVLADTIVRLLETQQISHARVELGAALHTVQDFYAHTNYVELRRPGTARELAWPFPSFNLLELAGNGAACDQSEPEPDTPFLTSGYYGASGPPTFVAKCIHGGWTDTLRGLNTSLGINKDSLDPLFSPHAFLHHEAARLARLATVDYVRGILNSLISGGMSHSDALETLAPLFGIEQIQLQSTNQASLFQLTIDVGRGGLKETGFFLPQESRSWTVPDLNQCLLCLLTGSGTVYELKVTGEWSASFTGLAGYTLRLPPSLEFVEVRSDLDVTTQLSGREHTDLLVLYPAGGPAHRINTYRIKPR